MAEPISIQQLKDASEDAISLAEFINKPENAMVTRRLASDIHSLQYYLDYMKSFAQRSYETYDEMIANASNLSENVSVFVTNDLDTSKNGIYTYNGTSFVKGEYQPENAAKDFVEAKLGGLEVFDGKVRAQDVSTVDGSTQAEVNKKTVFEYDTVAAMLADTTIVSGKVVSTNGYHAKQDGGGAKYTISSVATDYSIPLANGLHAIFNDTFDIRKFGIISDPLLNQTINIKRMAKYADKFKIYEIDFHNYQIMSPDWDVYETFRKTKYNGIGFNEPHYIKNLHFTMDKSKPMYQGKGCIICTVSRFGNNETYKFENISFDIHHPDGAIFQSGEADGGFNGIRFIRTGVLENVKTERHGYNAHFKDINFITPALTANLGLAIWFNELTFEGMKGDYIGYYSTMWADTVRAKNISGVYRDDLHASGRVLVTNLLHEEPEVGDSAFEYTQELHEFDNVQCIKYSTQLPYVAVKRHVMGVPTLNKLRVKNVSKGYVVGGDSNRLLVKDGLMEDLSEMADFSGLFDKMVLTNCYLSSYVVTGDNSSRVGHQLIMGKCTINGTNMFFNGTVLNEVIFNDCNILSRITTSGAKIKSIAINGGTINTDKLLGCFFDNLEINYTKITYKGAFNSLVSLAGSYTTDATAMIEYNYVNAPYATGIHTSIASAYRTPNNYPMQIIFLGSYFKSKPTLSSLPANVVITYNSPLTA